MRVWEEKEQLWCMVTGFFFFFSLFKFKSKLESKTADPQVINTGCKLRSNDHLGNQSSLNFSCIHSSVLGAGKATCDKI